MPRPPKSPPLAAAPIVAAERARLHFGDDHGELDCLYVQLDTRARGDVSEFLSSWERCCDSISVDWRAVRRPQSALVGFELRRCSGDDHSTSSLRLVFDVRKDRPALDALAETESLVVGSRPYGRFANAMAAYGVDGDLVRNAVRAAERGMKQRDARAS